jgi:hypothetical protein
MKKTIIFLLCLAFGAAAFAGNDNALSKQEEKAGWKLLWDGKTLDGWVACRDKNKIEDGWFVSDGTLCTRKFEGDNKTVVDIRTDRRYTDFILTLEVKITPGANSGVKYFVQTGKMANIGCEFQILDNDLHPDAHHGVGGNRTFGSLYYLIPADPAKTHFSVGEWNSVRIVVRGNHVEHWLNGEKVVDYYRNNQAFNALVKCSKFAEFDGFGNFRDGYIMLQNHKDEVCYKNIKIREL